MRFGTTLAVLAVSVTGAMADCTFPYCYGLTKSFFYACESDADCRSINRTECMKGLESPTPSGTVVSD